MQLPRVVIESNRPAAAAAQAQTLKRSGIVPIICTGPEGRDGGCPLLEDEPCDLLTDAGAVIFDLDLEQEHDREVLRRLGLRYPGLPVVTERTSYETRRHEDDLEHCTVVVPYSTDHTADAVIAALASTI